MLNRWFQSPFKIVILANLTENVVRSPNEPKPSPEEMAAIKRAFIISWIEEGLRVRDVNEVQAGANAAARHGFGLDDALVRRISNLLRQKKDAIVGGINDESPLDSRLSALKKLRALRTPEARAAGQRILAETEKLVQNRELAGASTLNPNSVIDSAMTPLRRTTERRSARWYA